MHFVLQWIDIIWLPLAFFFVHKDQRMWAIGTLLSCMAMMRMLSELMDSIGYSQGIIGFWTSMPVFSRGLMVYNLHYLGYLFLAYYLPNARGPMFMALSISVFFSSFVIFALLMVI
jgi:hypothetical protein